MAEEPDWLFWSQGAGSTPVYTAETVQPSLNLTGVSHAKASLLLYDILIPVLGSLLVVLNLAVVLSVGLILKRGQAPHRTTYLFLGNMALMDSVTGLAVLLGHFYPKQTRGEISCAIQIGLIVSTTLASVWSVGLIAIDRFLFIVHGLWYNSWVTVTRARGLILMSWLIGCVLGLLPAMGWRESTEGGKICWFIRLAPSELVILITAVGVVPILLVVVLYSLILYQALRKVFQLRNAHLETAQLSSGSTPHLRIFRGGRPSTTRQWKAVKIVLLTAGSFAVTWLPYFIACCVFVACKADHGLEDCRSLELVIAAPLAVLGFLNSLLNPLIYAWWHNGFRGLAQRLWCRRTSSSLRGQESQTTTKTSVTSSSNQESTKL